MNMRPVYLGVLGSISVALLSQLTFYLVVPSWYVDDWSLLLWLMNDFWLHAPSAFPLLLSTLGPGLITVFVGYAAARAGHAAHRRQSVWMGALAGGVTAILPWVFFLAPAAGMVGLENSWLWGAFSFSLRTVRILWMVHLSFWSLVGVCALLGGAGGWLASFRQRKNATTTPQTLHPNVKLALSLTLLVVASVTMVGEAALMNPIVQDVNSDASSGIVVNMGILGVSALPSLFVQGTMMVVIWWGWQQIAIRRALEQPSIWLWFLSGVALLLPVGSVVSLIWFVGVSPRDPLSLMGLVGVVSVAVVEGYRAWSLPISTIETRTQSRSGWHNWLDYWLVTTLVCLVLVATLMTPILVSSFTSYKLLFFIELIPALLMSVCVVTIGPLYAIWSGRKTVVWWVVANTVGGLLGGALPYIVSLFIAVTMQILRYSGLSLWLLPFGALPIVLCASVGVSQWLFLRNALTISPWWIATTILGCLVSMGTWLGLQIALHEFLRLDEVWTNALVFPFAFATLGIIQALHLSRYVQKTILWVPATMVAGLLGVFVLTFYVRVSASYISILSVVVTSIPLFGLVYGSITGLALLTIQKQVLPVSVSQVAPQPRTQSIFARVGGIIAGGVVSVVGMSLFVGFLCRSSLWLQVACVGTNIIAHILIVMILIGVLGFQFLAKRVATSPSRWGFLPHWRSPTRVIASGAVIVVVLLILVGFSWYQFITVPVSSTTSSVAPSALPLPTATIVPVEIPASPPKPTMTPIPPPVVPRVVRSGSGKEHTRIHIKPFPSTERVIVAKGDMPAGTVLTDVTSLLEVRQIDTRVYDDERYYFEPIGTQGTDENQHTGERSQSSSTVLAVLLGFVVVVVMVVTGWVLLRMVLRKLFLLFPRWVVWGGGVIGLLVLTGSCAWFFIGTEQLGRQFVMAPTPIPQSELPPTPTEDPGVDVIVARVDIPAGAVLTETHRMLDSRNIPTSVYNARASELVPVAEMSRLQGASVDVPFLAGEELNRSELFLWGDYGFDGARTRKDIHAGEIVERRMLVLSGDVSE